ncbi:MULTISPECIES: TetR/AcrR family transcriptional regulator [Methylobacterium]|uniref:TetR/AcrR family transcriptional regulator n=1 Tax=Methylobacterium longum TaxID=767694 RepID=A0ABT8ALN9_9HYPH|nr:MULTISPECIES: TetR/AcrR family transcriptional regulator [Methylobacterium]MCJ2099901.1 TetR/AcrR family transcriptional regulator [Methylobacterium sp. E-046]MDN3570376.1 TetR/AcrR family transcriptional regulator [Methylobacterium longum]GJE11374.1 putative HTH-type transcriptional regulator YxaF [Methylobacterium longum]
MRGRAELLPGLAEVFREHGYEGASLSLISRATGLGKGSLYNLFPEGKAEMAACVLAEIDGWFEANLYAPLRAAERPAAAVSAMFDAVETYFRSGQRVCLVGVVALGSERDRFAGAVRCYFARWIAALAGALTRSGREPAASLALAEEVVAQIQGAIVLARALDEPAVFSRAMTALRIRVAAAG